MKPLTLTLLTAVAVLAAGCSYTKTAKIKYPPPQKSALSSVKPKSVAIQVKDERQAGEKDYVLKQQTGAMDPTYTFVTAEPVPDLVREALKRELEANGHRVVSDGTAADANITLSLKRFLTTISGREKFA